MRLAEVWLGRRGAARSVLVSRGVVRQARSGTEGLGGSGGVRFGAAGVVGCVQASSIEVCSGAVRQAWQDKVWSGKAGFGWAQRRIIDVNFCRRRCTAAEYGGTVLTT